MEGSEVNPLRAKNPQMSTLANSEDPDVMQQGVHCLISQNQSSENKNIFFGMFNL